MRNAAAKERPVVAPDIDQSVTQFKLFDLAKLAWRPFGGFAPWDPYDRQA
jgi:hypothetical protein